MHTLTRPQLLAIAGLVALSIVDIAVTLWGFYNLQMFVETNPLLARFARWTPPYPIIFPFALAFMKIAVIALIIVLTAWFNAHDKDTKWHGGNICCYGAFAINAIFMAGLLIVNSTRIVY